MPGMAFSRVYKGKLTLRYPVSYTHLLDKVRPGHYTLHAFTDGVLGEYIKTDIIVEAGKQIDLGKLKWTCLLYTARCV